MNRRFRLLAAGVALCFSAIFPALAMGSPVALAKQGGFYRQTNLVSDIPGLARVTDANLVNPWGISHPPTGPWWVSDNGTGVSTLYQADGTPFPVGHPLVVTIPPPAGGSSSAPTGNIFNPTNDFSVSSGGPSGPARFIFATEDGTISGWNPSVDPTHAVLAVDNSASGAVYKGLAMGSNAAGNFLFATNFHAGTVDVFDSHFAPVSLSGAFTDPALPSGYAPFGIANLNGSLFVTYAKQDSAKHDDDAGPGRGFVDQFDTNGNLIRRVASGGTLNSPWGLAIAPNGFGRFGKDLLVGNFGDGRINAFDLREGDFRGQLQGQHSPIVIDGLWGLEFGNGAVAGPTTTLFFTAGLNHEANGLFGSITKGDR